MVLFILIILSFLLVPGAFAAPEKANLEVSQIDVDTIRVCFEQPATTYIFVENVVQVSDEPFNTRAIARDTTPTLEVFRSYGDNILVYADLPGEEICENVTSTTFLSGWTYHIGHVGLDDCSNSRRRCDMSAIEIETLTFYTSPPLRSVLLEWDPVVDSRLDHYTVFWGTQSRIYNESPLDTVETTQEIDLAPGQYYFAVKACDEDESFCSDFSKEVAATLEW